MVFNSFTFIFLFLPVVYVIFFILGRLGYKRLSIVWLVLSSLYFYSWWSLSYLPLLLLSIIVNFSLGKTISVDLQIAGNFPRKKVFLILGIVFNLALIFYYKYSYFFIGNLSTLLNTTIDYDKPILPLAISFYTFQQIAFLVDCYKNKVRNCHFLNYCCFITFFPHLVAGPILHHAEIIPQFKNPLIYKFSLEQVFTGFTLFFIGLFKKIVIADGIAKYTILLFETAAKVDTVGFVHGWMAALGYTFQLYFDFSGYSDMAIGLAAMVGIVLPINFNSPYKAKNIIDFWRRWHITLSRFLKDYLYIPLGGNRHGEIRRYTNLMITMLLGGLWHGAGWTFIIWGGLHGFYLLINHAWRYLRRIPKEAKDELSFWKRVLCHGVTFTAVVVAWVFFRANSVGVAVSILKGMAGLNGGWYPIGFSLQPLVVWITFLLSVTLFFPNSQEILVYIRKWFASKDTRHKEVMKDFLLDRHLVGTYEQS